MQHKTPHIIEAALLTAGKPLNIQQLQGVLAKDGEPPEKKFVLAALDELADDLAGRGVELRQVASGYRLQVKSEFEPWVARLFEERPPRYSRALLETLALIAYRQPITRAEIEEVRGVSVSSSIIKTLIEREWIKVVGQRDVPGRPSMYGTTNAFLDYFNLKTVSGLPALDELMDLDAIDKQLDMLGEEQSDAPVSDQAGDTAAAQSGLADSDTSAEIGSAELSAPQPEAADMASPSHAESETRSELEPAQIEGIEPAGDSTEADIDGLVEMLDSLDASGVDAPLEAEPVEMGDDIDGAQRPHPPLSETEPSMLARSGDTAAAVESARQNIVANADRVLSGIADRTQDVPADASTDRPAAPGDSPDSTDLIDSPDLRDRSPERQESCRAEPLATRDPDSVSHDADIAALLDADNRNHEAARGESVTPADSLRRSRTDSSD